MRGYVTELTALAIAGLISAGAMAQFRPPINTPATLSGAMERVVTGLPFSAESVTTFFQTASDGSHVTHETSAEVARDSSGRTRYSQPLLPLLPGGPKEITIIRDPVAGVRFWIDPRERVARRETMRAAGREGAPRSEEAPSADEAAIKLARQAVMRVLADHGGESLARALTISIESGRAHFIEGLTTSGAKASAVIPAGQIGNDKPLTVTAEAWYSAELSIFLRSKVHDPILGDTLFEIRRLQRSEPSASLFEVPSGYRLTGNGSEPGRK